MAYQSFGGGYADGHAQSQNYKEGIVWQLMTMGFSQEQSIKAAIATNNAGVDVAVDWISSHNNNHNSSAQLSSSYQRPLQYNRVDADPYPNYHAPAPAVSTDRLTKKCDICGLSIQSLEFSSHRLAHQWQQEQQQQQQQLENASIPCEHCDNKLIPVDQFAEHQETHRKQQQLQQNNSLLHQQIVLLQSDHEDKQQHSDALEAQLGELQKQVQAMSTETQSLKAEISKREQEIQTIQSEAKQNKVEYPKWWDMQQLQGVPYGHEKLIDFNLDDAVAKEVIASFKATAGNQVTQVQGIMHKMMYDKWWNEKQTLLQQIGANNLNQRNLFHGARGGAAIMNTIIREGFRAEFNTAFAVGQGTYFAKAASTSVGYTTVNNGVHKMFRCAVVCGEGIAGNGKYTLKAWPKKPNGYIYDCLVSGALNDPSVVVIHENTRIYPMFVVTFK